EHRAHLARFEVARVDPIVRAGDLEGALGVGDDLVADLKEELLDAFVLVDLDEALLGARTLVLDGLAIDAAEGELQELPGPIQVAAMDAPDAQHRLVGILLFVARHGRSAAYTLGRARVQAAAARMPRPSANLADAWPAVAQRRIN